jgi:hypothetical protein
MMRMRILESVDLELVSLDEANLGHPVADVLALIALELKHLAVLGVFYDRSIASELLRKLNMTSLKTKEFTPQVDNVGQCRSLK